MKKHIFKKSIAFLLALVMMVGMLPATVFADGTDTITVYVTASYEDEPLTATASGSAIGAAGKKMIYMPVEISASGTTVKDALQELSKQYYDSAHCSIASSQYLVDTDNYWGLRDQHKLVANQASFIRVNGVVASSNPLAVGLSKGDHIAVDIGKWDHEGDNWFQTMTPTFIASSTGNYLGYKQLISGSALSFKVGYYDMVSFPVSPGGTTSSGISVYVTKDLSNLGTPLDAVDATYSPIFTELGDHYIVAVDSDLTTLPHYCASAAKIVVKETVSTSPPALKGASSAALSTYVEKPYNLDLSTIFKDDNGNPLAYSVDVNSFGFAAFAGSNYNYTPTPAGIYILKFKANNGIADSDEYSVTLTAETVPAYTVALNNLSTYYATLNDYSETNAQWGIADLMACSPSALSITQQRIVLESLIAAVDTAYKAANASNLARCIIVLKSMGYDSRYIKPSVGEEFDAVAKMNKLINGTDELYILPYMLIALQQFDMTYSEQIQTLKTKLMAKALLSGGWGYDGLDADTFAPIILALSPYYLEELTYNKGKTIKQEIDFCVDSINGMLGESGSFPGGWWAPETDNICATGLVIASLVSVGKDPVGYKKSGKSLMDGLMWNYNDTGYFDDNPSPSSFNNEQAFRGLVAYNKYLSGGAFALYDFSDRTFLPADSTLTFENCPVYFKLNPSDAIVEVKNAGSTIVKCVSISGIEFPGVYDLGDENYSYNVSAPGHKDKNGNVSVTASDAAIQARKTVAVSLTSIAPETAKDITVTVSVKIPPEDTNILYTYKSNSSVYKDVFNSPKVQNVTLKAGNTVFDALAAACDAASVSYIERGKGYISEIGEWSEFDRGPLSGWQYKVGTTVAKVGSREYILNSDSTVTWYYTDDYTKESGSEIWSPSPTVPSATTLIPTVTAKNGVASASVSAADVTKAITDSKGKDTIVIAPEIKGKANKVSVDIPKGSLSDIASKTTSDLTVKTPVGNVTLPNAALDSIAAQAKGSNVTISLSTVDKTGLTADQQKAVGTDTVYDISVMSGTTAISSFGGSSLSISLPYTLKAGEDKSNVAVWYLNDAGKLEQMACTYDKTTGLATFTTTHLSKYIVGYEEWKNVFADLKTTDWFFDAVKYASKNELMTGTNATLFAPNSNMTRSMLVTVLYRLDGKPVVTGENTFTDVKAGEWYTDAVKWAKANAIVGGYNDKIFGSNDNVTREQLASILYRYASFKKYDVSKTKELTGFTDANAIQNWALASMKWANAEGIVTGTTTTTFSPAGNASRAQVATMLMRFVENIVK